MKAANDFKAFVLRGNVVDLAVGIIIGAAFGTVVTAFVKDLITPPDCGHRWQTGLRRYRLHDQPQPFPCRGLHQRGRLVPDYRGGRLLLCRPTSQCTDEPAQDRDARPREDARMPVLPEQHPDCGEPVRLLHAGNTIPRGMTAAAIGRESRSSPN